MVPLDSGTHSVRTGPPLLFLIDCLPSFPRLLFTNNYKPLRTKQGHGKNSNSGDKRTTKGLRSRCPRMQLQGTEDKERRCYLPWSPLYSIWQSVPRYPRSIRLIRWRACTANGAMANLPLISCLQEPDSAWANWARICTSIGSSRLGGGAHLRGYHLRTGHCLTARWVSLEWCLLRLGWITLLECKMWLSSDHHQ